jgi:hypothetical protein
MRAADEMSRNSRLFRFWARLGCLNHDEYLKAQLHCNHFLGGWVAGLNINERGEVNLIIEKP